MENAIKILANKVASLLNSYASILTKESSKITAEVKMIPEEAAKYMSKRNFWRNTALFGAPLAFFAGQARGKNQAVQQLLAPQEKAASFFKLGALLITRLTDEYLKDETKIENLNKEIQSLKLASEMADKGIISPSQIINKAKEIQENNLETDVKVKLANNDLTFVEGSHSSEMESAFANYAKFLLGE